MSAWFVLLGVSYGLKVGAHIGVDAVVRLFPPVGRRITSYNVCYTKLLRMATRLTTVIAAHC